MLSDSTLWTFAAGFAVGILSALLIFKRGRELLKDWILVGAVVAAFLASLVFVVYPAAEDAISTYQRVTKGNPEAAAIFWLLVVIVLAGAVAFELMSADISII